MKSREIAKNIFWVGVQNPDLRIFDIVMNTPYGTSYNSYIVKGKFKTALIETVKYQFFDEFIEKIREVIDPQCIDYLVVNHTEPDHAGSVEHLLRINPEITVVTNYNAVHFLSEITNHSFPYFLVSPGSTLDLGERTLRVINAPLLHWPETQFTYLEEDGILFPCDSFGCHYSSDKLFDDEITEDIVPAYKYYYEVILKPFDRYLRSAVHRVMKLPIKMICPGHGPVLRTDLQRYMKMYLAWSEPVHNPDPRPVIVMAWASAYGYTETLARSIAEGINSAGDFNLKSFDLVQTSPEEVVKACDGAKGLLLGSPTINRDAVPPVWQVLTSLSPITHERMIAGAFGAYGWSGEAVPIIEARFQQLRMKVLPGLRENFKPCVKRLAEAVEYGKAFAAAINGDETLIEPFLKWQIRTNPNWSMPSGINNYMKQYATKDIVILWNPDRCTHDTNCYTELSSVFRPQERPWIDMDGADPLDIIRTIDRCPSGALKYYLPEGSSVDPELAHGPGNLKKTRS